MHSTHACCPLQVVCYSQQAEYDKLVGQMCMRRGLLQQQQTQLYLSLSVWEGGGACLSQEGNGCILVKSDDVALLPVGRRLLLLWLLLRAIEAQLLAADIAQVQLPVSCQGVTTAQLLHLQTAQHSMSQMITASARVLYHDSSYFTSCPDCCRLVYLYISSVLACWRVLFYLFQDHGHHVSCNARAGTHPIATSVAQLCAS